MIFLSARACDILKKFKMKNSKPISTPAQENLMLKKESDKKMVDATQYKSIGSLSYMTGTRPYIVFGVGLLNRFIEESHVCHLQGVKRILCYIKGTLTDGIFYANDNDVKLVGYTDNDWTRDIETRKSKLGYIFHLGASAVPWSLRKQPIVALSMAEAEYITTTSCATQVVWMRRILEVMHHKQNTPTKIFCDNKFVIELNRIFHGRSKHIDIRYHKIWELILVKEVGINYCPIENQVVDIFTKPLKMELFHKVKKMLGMIKLNLRETM